MDFGALPPEINSTRMYLGPGAATMLAASDGWGTLAVELQAAASGCESAVAKLTDELWQGPSAISMAAAVAPYLLWLRATAAQCEQTASQASVAVAAYEAAYALTVPPPVVVANRVQLAALIATNIFGQNTPAIMAAEAEYSEMWAQDATAMYDYAAGSASATSFTMFNPPPQTTNLDGIAAQSGTLAQMAGSQVAVKVQATSAQLMSSVPQTLQSLAAPGSSAGVGLSPAAMSAGAALGPSGASSPLGALSSLAGTSSKGAADSAGTGLGTLSGLATGLASSLNGGTAGLGLDALGLGSDLAGFGSDGAGLGADGGGIGIDLQGLQLDYQGLQLDYEGAGSILGAQGVAGLSGGGVPGLGTGTSAGVGVGDAVGTLSVPPSWAEAASSVTPLPALDGGGAVGNAASSIPASSTGAGVSKLPLGGMVGRASEGAVQRVGFRVSLIPHSPAAG